MGMLQDIYDKMNDKLPKLGRYHKCLFHLHTPASHDYATLEKYEKGNYKINVEELHELCIARGLFNLENISSKIEDILTENKDIYSNEETLLKFLLIAWELSANKNELVVISDHNVIEGYKPLITAISIIKKFIKLR